MFLEVCKRVAAALLTSLGLPHHTTLTVSESGSLALSFAPRARPPPSRTVRCQTLNEEASSKL
eukprot:2454300-Rhodomonas_salina.1